MKRKYWIGLALALCIAGMLYCFFSREKDLQDYIPAKSKMVARLSVSAIQQSENFSQLASLIGLPLNVSDIKSDAFVFITPNEYFGLAFDLQDTNSFLSNIPSKDVTEQDGLKWIWTKSGWLVTLSGKKLFALGPGTAQERDRLRHTLRVMIDSPADEGFGHTAKANALKTDAPIAFVGSTKVLPAPYGTLLRLALPEKSGEIVGAVTQTTGHTVISGSLWHEDFNFVAPQKNAPSIPPSDYLLLGTIITDGSELLKRIRQDASARMLLKAMDDTTSAAKRLEMMRGEIHFLVSDLDSAGNALCHIEGTDVQGKAIAIGNAGRLSFETPPFPVAREHRATMVIQTGRLLAAPLPESIRGMLRLALADCRQIIIQTEPQGAFQITFSE